MEVAHNPEDLARILQNPAAERIGKLLLSRGERLAVCETTAGGLISAQLLAVTGASGWFDRGVVAYGGTSKQDTTNVTVEELREYGAVSVTAVERMAVGLQRLAGVQWSVAESGIAGPQTSRRSTKPAGSVSIAIAGPDGVIGAEHLLPGDRREVMAGIALRCLELLEARLSAASAPLSG